MFTIAIILFSSFLSWNWGDSSLHFHLKDSFVSSEKSAAQIQLFQKQENLLAIVGTFYNGSSSELSIFYKLTTIKSGQSISSSNQSGNLKVNGKMQVLLSNVTVNLNENDFYIIKLQVFENNKIIAEDSKTFYGDKISQI